MDMHLPDHSSEGMNLSLTAFKEEEIRKIYINKVIYSLLKYNQQSDNIKAFYKEKYEYARNLHRGNFEGGVLEEVRAILDEEKEKYKAIRQGNQEVVDFIAPIIVHNFTNGCNPQYTEEQRIKYLLEYVTKTFKYNFDAKKYNHNIPFGMDYDLEFSNSVPVSDFKSLLITKEILGSELASIIKILGDYIGLDIRIVIAENEDTNELHYLNAVLLHGKTNDVETLDKLQYNISYIDATSYLSQENNKEIIQEIRNEMIQEEIEDIDSKLTDEVLDDKIKERLFLLSKYMFNKGNKYSKFNFINSDISDEKKEGQSLAYDSIEIDDITRIVENDERLCAVKYVESDIFEKKETSSK